jgi:hypothetical protein
MAKKIRDTSPKPPRIVDTSPKPERIDPAVVAAALGAELVGHREPGGSPVSVLATRQGMYRSLKAIAQATASDNGASFQINLSEQDWKALQQLATLLTENGFTPSIGQVAAALLKTALARCKEVDQGSFHATLLRELAAAKNAESGGS